MDNGDTIGKAIIASNRFRDVGLQLETNSEGESCWVDAGGMVFDFYTLDEACCFIQGYEFMKVSK